jgi:sulfur-oxidizing protein SoxY
MNKPNRSRRRFIAGAAAGAVIAQSRLARAQLAIQPLGPLIEKLTNGARVNEGRVSVDIPRLADNGHSVPLKVSVASPMNDREFVKTIHILSERNPRPLVAAFHFNPHCGRAEVVTRVRLNGSQRVHVIAGLSDGSYWSGSAEVEVTETACLDAT